MTFLKLYSAFERAVSAIILVGMVVVILIAVFSFLRTTLQVGLDYRGALDYGQFQLLFDRVLVAVIAVELAHSIQQMVAGRHGLQQLRTVVVIGMLAIIRKIILLEVDTTTGVFLMGIAAATLALGAVFLVINWIEWRLIGEDAEDGGPGRGG